MINIITRDKIMQALSQNIITLENDRDGTILCSIGDKNSYFDLDPDSNQLPAETYLQKIPIQTIVDKIYSSFETLKNSPLLQNRYNYCVEFIDENIKQSSNRLEIQTLIGKIIVQPSGDMSNQTIYISFQPNADLNKNNHDANGEINDTIACITYKQEQNCIQTYAYHEDSYTPQTITPYMFDCKDKKYYWEDKNTFCLSYDIDRLDEHGDKYSIICKFNTTDRTWIFNKVYEHYTTNADFTETERIVIQNLMLENINLTYNQFDKYDDNFITLDELKNAFDESPYDPYLEELNSLDSLDDIDYHNNIDL